MNLFVSAQDAEEYSESLGQIGEGWWRQIAWAFRVGIPEALGMEPRDWALKYHGYARMPISERREAARELTSPVDEGGMGMTQREAGDVLGVDAATVNRDLKPVADATEPGPVPDPRPVGQQVDEPPLWDEPAPVADATEPEPEPERPVVNEGDEWYTPRWLFDALGITFAIDVCAPLDRAHSAVPADLHFTIEDDGLAQSWHGTVWCNPPYSQTEPWARRMIHHGDGLLLAPVPMNAGWCTEVWDACDAIRLFQAMEFARPDGSTQRPAWWLQLAAFGPVATEALARLQPLGAAAHNKRRVASPMWRRA